MQYLYHKSTKSIPYWLIPESSYLGWRKEVLKMMGQYQRALEVSLLMKVCLN